MTRKELKAIEIPDDKIDYIMEKHTEVTDALKKEANKYSEAQKQYETEKARADSLQKQIDETSPTEFKDKYEEVKKEFEGFKKNIEAEKEMATKHTTYEQMLKEAGIDEKRYKAILRATDFESMSMGDDGKFKDSETLSKNIVETWGDFIVSQQKNGAKVANPPANDSGAKSPGLAGALRDKMNGNN